MTFIMGPIGVSTPCVITIKKEYKDIKTESYLITRPSHFIINCVTCGFNQTVPIEGLSDENRVYNLVIKLADIHRRRRTDPVHYNEVYLGAKNETINS